jgi:hypothetical protein
VLKKKFPKMSTFGGQLVSASEPIRIAFAIAQHLGHGLKHGYVWFGALGSRRKKSLRARMLVAEEFFAIPGARLHVVVVIHCDDAQDCVLENLVPEHPEFAQR